MAMLYLLPAGYKCENRTCDWALYQECTDWGYYSKTNGDCSVCKDDCNKDPNCGAIECGGGYCSWWKIDKCMSANARTISNQYLRPPSTSEKG